MTIRHLGIVAACVVAAVALSGCGDDRRMPVPVPSDTPTALPDVTGGDAEQQVDPRCIEQYGGKAGLVFEGDIRERPVGFPTAPEFGVLCWIETLAPTHQAGHYATTYYTPYSKVLDYYERSIDAGPTGRADSIDGELLTGVLGEASFYVVQNGTGYSIHWARDGDYAD